jgi:recombination protein RecA
MGSNAKIKKLMADMNKKFGDNAIRFSSEITEAKYPRVSTGVVALDTVIGGGYPIGRFIHVSGAFSSTKSTTVYHGIREFQDYFKSIGSDLRVLLVQGENGSWTREYGESLGIDTDNLMINESASMEEALEVARQVQEREICGAVVFDSFAALAPMKEYASNMEDSVQMGLKPKLFDEYFRKFQALNNRLSREGKHVCTIIGINQLREKIGGYGDPEYEGGGRAIGFTSSLTIRLKRGDWITIGAGENKAIIGQEVKFKIHKSKVSIPQKTGTWDVYIDEGGPVEKGHVDNFKSLVLEGVAYGVIDKSGSWFYYKDDVKVQGADGLVEVIRERPDLYEEIRAEVLRRAEEVIEEEMGQLTDEQRQLLEQEGQIEEELVEDVAESPKKKPAKKKSTKKKTTKKGAKKK